MILIWYWYIAQPHSQVYRDALYITIPARNLLYYISVLYQPCIKPAYSVIIHIWSIPLHPRTKKTLAQFSLTNQDLNAFGLPLLQYWQWSFLLVFLYNALSMWYLNPSVSQIFHVCAQQIRQSPLFLQVKLIKCNWEGDEYKKKGLPSSPEWV